MKLTYTLKKSSQRRRLTIIVERDCRVVVHAPERLAEDEIHEIVASKRPWIYSKITHPQKYKLLPHGPGKELVNGESALYLGRQYRIEIVNFDLLQVQFTRRFLIPSGLVQKGPTALREWYIQRAKEKIIPRVKSYACKLGVEAAKIKIVDNRYRWGSCTLKNNVNLNWRLIKAPMFVIDYVIVHELAHLLESNHTPRFWNIVRTQITDLAKAKNWLRENGQELEEVF